jgi:peptide deformylase
MELTKVPADILARKVQEATQEDIKAGVHAQLVLDMKKAMKEHAGVGLAANQIGIDLAVFVILARVADAQKKPEVYFNPEITEYSNDTDEIEEGCLSIPGWYTSITRSKKIMFKAIDEQGNKIKFKAKGFLARVLQHETDHLNGITIKERAKK